MYKHKLALALAAIAATGSLGLSAAQASPAIVIGAANPPHCQQYPYSFTQSCLKHKVL